MNSPLPSHSRSARRTRRIAAAAGALGMTTALAASFLGGGIAQTEAARNDTEKATAEVKASWMQGFTRVTNPGWKMRNSDRLPGYKDAKPTSPVSATHNYTLTSSDEIELDARNSFGDSAGDSDTVPSRNTSNNLWMGRYVDEGSLNSDIARAGFCMSFPDPKIIQSETTECGASTENPARLAAHQNTIGYTYSIYSSASKLSRVNVAGFASTALCHQNGTSEASLEFGDESVLELANEYWIVGVANGYYRAQVSFLDIIPEPDPEDGQDRYGGTSNQWMRYKVNEPTSDRSNFVLVANVRANTYTAPFYALAEMDLIIQVYSSGGGALENGHFIDQINLPLTRSECGFSDGTLPLPEMAGTWRGDDNQLGWPGRSLGDQAGATPIRSGIFTYPEVGVEPQSDQPVQDALQRMRQSDEATRSLPPATTVTSPTEHTTAPETTTSAPPNPDDDANTSTSTRSRSTSAKSSSAPAPTRVTSTPPTAVTPTSKTTVKSSTSTSTPPAESTTTATPTAVPEIVIPDEPGELLPTARVEDVDTITVGEDELDVVVVGNEVPSDARGGAAALEIWLGGGNPSSTWETFASDDPDENGWRWAAINQKTGTIVYIV